MLGKLVSAIHRGLFWTYERGTWQYDIMVVMILAFIFLTPRDWFHDRPAAPLPAAAQISERSQDVVLLRDDRTQKVYRLRASLINATGGEGVAKGCQRVLQNFTGRSWEITRIEPAVDSTGQVVSYAVWVRD